MYRIATLLLVEGKRNAREFKLKLLRTLRYISGNQEFGYSIKYLPLARVDLWIVFTIGVDRL